MIHLVGEANVVSRISYAYDSYEKEAYKIAKYYAGEIMSYFILEQRSVPAEVKGEFWTNHTFRAANAFFTKPYVVPGTVGLTLAYTPHPWYTERLENDFGGKFSALPKLINRFWPSFQQDLKTLFEDRS